MKKKLIEYLKKIVRELYKNGLPGHIFSPLILAAILTVTFLAGFKVASFFELITHPQFPLVEVYFVSLGGAIGLKWVKKDGSADK